MNIAPMTNKLVSLVSMLKIAYQIDMKYSVDLSSDALNVILSKGNYSQKLMISRYQCEDNLYERIIIDHVLAFLEKMNAENVVTQNQDMNNFKFSEKDLDAIGRMKEAARLLATPGKNPIIAGGFFTSIYWNEEPKDIDIFYLDGEDETSFGFNIPYEKNITHHGQEYLDNPMITKTITFSGSKRQLIFTKYATRRELVDHFDMLHCCVSYDVKKDKLYISPATLEAIKKKVIWSNGTNAIKPWRHDKMLQKGWNLETFSV